MKTKFNLAHFSRMPQSKKPHTKFQRPFDIIGTTDHGKITPVYCRLVSPGEVIKERIIGNIRMSTPIAPLFSGIKASFNAFYIPLRLVWTHTKEFFGENTTTAGPQTTVYTIPSDTLNLSGDTMSQVSVGTVSHYLGKPLYKGASLDNGTATTGRKVSVLKERAFWLTYSEWFRHEQIMNPVLLTTDDTGGIGSLDGSLLAFNSTLPSCVKDFDYFTTCTITPNGGSQVSLPLGTVAPIIGDGNNLHSTIDPLAFGSTGTTSPGTLVAAGSSGNNQAFIYTGSAQSSNVYGINKTNLVADLRSATAANINDLYTAMAASAWFYNQNYGAKYFEAMEIHYGTSNPDLVLQRPEHLGKRVVNINVQQVLSQAGAASDSSSKLGQPGANSNTYFDFPLFHKSFGEWGYVLITMNTYHERYYSAGIQCEDMYSDLFDFYFPEFAMIGDKAVLRDEIFYASGSAQRDAIFGYQEAWAEMRYNQNRCTGLLDPYAAAGTNSSQNALRYWVLADKYTSFPTFSKSWMVEDRDAISEALVSGSSGPDYLFSLWFDETTINLLPLYSVPGLPGRGRGIL